MRSPSEHIKLLQRRVDFLKSREHQNSYDLAEIGSLEWALANLPTKQEQGEPVAWQWRRKDKAWSLDNTFNSEVYATTSDSEVRPLYTTPQPKQEQGEPVAWMMHNSRGDEISITESNLRHHQPAFVQDLWKDSTPLYTHPQPKREWVGLTPEDAIDIIWSCRGAESIVRATEAKLKEKNT
jgi:hypothetical protein